jgi:nucleoside phosphorylase
VESLKPDLLINAGTAGGFESKGMAIGDVLISSTIHNHDRRMILPIFVDYGVHNHTAVETPRLREVRKHEKSWVAWQLPSHAVGGHQDCYAQRKTDNSPPLIPLFSQALKFKLGVVTTGNSLDHVEADDALMAANGAYIVLSNNDDEGNSPFARY